jgi:hypothetical protein
LITRNQDGDAPFAFAVANRELTAFLGQNRQPYQSVTTPCVSMSERLRQDEERAAAEERARQQAAEAANRQADQTRERSVAEIMEMRENRLALSVLLLVFSLLAFGGCFLLVIKNKPTPAKIMGGVGAGMLILAIIAFIARPSLATVEAAQAKANDAQPAPDRFAGPNICRLVQQRSRLTISSSADVPLDWNANGCVNGRTQYAQNGEVWSRILISNEQPLVSVSEFRPGTGEYVLTRYQLDNATMERIRAARRQNEPRACSADSEARTLLADQQRDIAAMLPQLPNERLVYACENQRAGRSRPR